jgi:uncharacterized protein YodC (DUF2158 family)
MTIDEIHVGDKVYLVSGSPRMVVTGFNLSSVIVAWFYKREFKFESFPAGVLTKFLEDDLYVK